MIGHDPSLFCDGLGKDESRFVTNLSHGLADGFGDVAEQRDRVPLGLDQSVPPLEPGAEEVSPLSPDKWFSSHERQFHILEVPAHHQGLGLDSAANWTCQFASQEWLVWWDQLGFVQAPEILWVRSETLSKELNLFRPKIALLDQFALEFV